MKFSTKGWYKVLEEATYYSNDIDVDVLAWDNTEQEYKLRHMEFEPDDFEMPTTPKSKKSKKIKGLDAKTEDLLTTPKEVRLSVEMAEDLNSAINHLFGLVKLNQVKLTQGEAIALRTFEDLVDRATSQFNQVVKKVIEQAEGK